MTMQYVLVPLIVILMLVVLQRFVKAIQLKTGDADRDHCEQLFAILLVALVTALVR